MPTSRYVESSFWNFDALFQPQNHPAREMHDTFFLANPEKTRLTPTSYSERVKDIHEASYKCEWNPEESLKNVLRTHTTACSARMLYEIGQNKDNLHPIKLFSIDRVFRNESVDATHLAEFHQIEGLVLGKNLSLGHLMGTLQGFYEKLNLKNIKFKPAFNPYTEPSLEIFAFHEKMNKWIEIGNSGIFRPEVLEPMGIKDDWRVIAWGLSLERPAMIKYNLDNIRDLLGSKVSLEFIKDSSMCYF
ncbi:Phenylalanyl-tRNA synthetase, beta subunit [Trachipleistophora hominis]|uniref:phenylalanine--tRNA ligase n=1 Tax=Trachipleistophora hominis TaxID=72359 RepID=L7JV29_TRAHO|nr:Phenylalanyl-tRNA synthetase, beta subunit [Trachipleistophora hominis]